MRWLALCLCCGAAGAQAELRLDVPAELAARLKPHLNAESGERRLREASTDILATEGYFSPQIHVEAQAEPPAGDLLLRIDPGPRTHVTVAEIDIAGPVPPERRAALLKDWLLPVGKPFRQADWNDAKNQILNDLLAEEHAGARLLDSLADIDPETQSAALHVSYDAGPRYRYGELEIDGLHRFRPDLIARYNRELRPGKPYRAEEVQALVHALQGSPYFSSVRGQLDLEHAVREDEAGTLQAPVRLSVREQPVHRARFGAGASSNTGARVEASYGNIDFLRRAWQLDTGLRWEEKRQTFYSDVFLPPTRDGERYGAGFVAEQSDIEQLRIQRQAFGVQRIEQRGRLEERLSLSWQHERRQPGNGEWTTSRALVPNVTWSWRNLDQTLDPRRGLVLQLSVGGGGKALLSDQNFLRLYGRGQFYLPVGARDTLSLRTELGRTFADSRQHVPQDYLFRTGGTGSVRGYSYQSLGIREGKATVGGRYLATASIEYTHWLNASWGMAAFVDAGDAVDALDDARLAVGYGLGARWRSPAGPIGVDLAYGERSREMQLHFSLAIPF
jgi:translocation and assembly module TamA